VRHSRRVPATLGLLGLIAIVAVLVVATQLRRPPEAPTMPAVAPPASMDRDTAGLTIPSPTPAPSLVPGSTNAPRQAPLTAAEAEDRGVTTGAKPGLVPGSVNATSLKLTTSSCRSTSAHAASTRRPRSVSGTTPAPRSTASSSTRSPPGSVR
jgi:hypothetical protein